MFSKSSLFKIKTVKMQVTSLRHKDKRNPVTLSPNQNTTTPKPHISIKKNPLKIMFDPWSKLFDCQLAGEALCYSTIYPNSCDLGTTEYSGLRPSQQSRLLVRPLAVTFLKCAASLAACHYDRTCRPIKSIFLLSPARCLIVRP